MKCNSKIMYYCNRQNYIEQDTQKVVKVDWRTHQTQLSAFCKMPGSEEAQMRATINGTWEDYLLYQEDMPVAKASISWVDRTVGEIREVHMLPQYRNWNVIQALVSNLTKRILDQGNYSTISVDVADFEMRKIVEAVGYIPE